MKDHREFKKNLLTEKKRRFLDAVSRSSKTLDIVVPAVHFWEEECPESSGTELAHYHYETHTICISERRLRAMNFSDIEETATHEVTHATDKTREHPKHHSTGFYNRHREVKTASWTPAAAGIVHLTGRASDVKGSYPQVKPDKECRENSCQIQKKLATCPFCKDRYCPKHITPKQPLILGGIRTPYEEYAALLKDAHPCPEWASMGHAERANLSHSESRNNHSAKKETIRKSQRKTEERPQDTTKEGETISQEPEKRIEEKVKPKATRAEIPEKEENPVYETRIIRTIRVIIKRFWKWPAKNMKVVLVSDNVFVAESATNEAGIAAFYNVEQGKTYSIVITTKNRTKTREIKTDDIVNEVKFNIFI